MATGWKATTNDYSSASSSSPRSTSTPRRTAGKKKLNVAGRILPCGFLDERARRLASV
jgi:hypothetical protein